MDPPAAAPCSPPWTLPVDVTAALDVEMNRAVRDVAGPLTPSLSRVLGAGGKKLRPALTLAVADLLGPTRPETFAGHRSECTSALPLAASIELLHCATLVHDDLIDEADTRRGVATISALEGTPTAVVGGDLLIAVATLTAARADPRAGVVIASTLAALCRGEALQESRRWQADVPLDGLTEAARLKTGALLQAACHLGADAVDASPADRAAVGEFGMNFGVSLQLLDDVLDLVSTPQLSGKPVGADFSSGTLTVPAALAFEDTATLQHLFRPDVDDLARQRAVNMLQQSSRALAATMTLARSYADRARAALSTLTADACAPGRLGTWPSTYLATHLEAMVSEQHRWLVQAHPAPLP